MLQEEAFDKNQKIMTKIPKSFERVIKDSPFLNKVNHAPDASKEVQRNSAAKAMPWADEIGNYQRNKGIPFKSHSDSKVYIVGGGIAGMAAAYYFMKDGHVPGENIVILDQLSVEGGSLDGAGNATEGYIIRGGREMDMTYENFWDLMQDIPALELPAPYSVLDEYRLINDYDSNYSKSRLIHQRGDVQDFSKFNLSKRDQKDIVKLLMMHKDDLNDMRIEDYFSEDFLVSNFWILWRTMFAFENWHSLLECKLYMHRFLHDIDGMKDLSCLVFPKYNQYDTFVKPLQKFLQDKGVRMETDVLVTDMAIHSTTEAKVVKELHLTQAGEQKSIKIGVEDYVIVTTGSMTEDTRYGTNTTVATEPIDNAKSGQSKGWTLWKNLAAKSPVFGKPEKFCGNIKESAWQSATLTCRPSAFTDRLADYAVNDPYSGKTVTGGIITITDSNWLMSFTCNRQPHFPSQPDDVLVLWVYGLYMDTPGNYIKKPMVACTGNEILAELCYHIGIEGELENVIEHTIVRTAYMPYITSMFLARAQGDRPQVVPEGCTNLGLIGQFVETNNDVVFTMESSVRTARIAVYTLLNLNKQVPDIAPMQYDIRQLLKAAKALNDYKSIPGEGVLRKVLKGTYYEHILPELADEEVEKEASFVTEQLHKLQDWLTSWK